MDQLKVIGAWALRWWGGVLAVTIACLMSVSLWLSHMTATGTRFGWPITELLGGALTLVIGLLWAPLLSDTEARRKSLLRRLGQLPDAIQALLAATLVLSWTLAGILLLDGAVGAVRVGAL